MKECIICNSKFNNRTKNELCCSKSCSYQYQLEYAKNKYYQLIEFREHKRKYDLKRSKWYSRSKNFNQAQIAYRKTKKYRIVLKRYANTENAKFIRRLAVIRRRAKKRNVIESYSKKEWKTKLLKSNGICQGINGKCLSVPSKVGINKLAMDHIYPINQAYKDFKKTGIKRIYTINDIQPLCKKCNASKRDKIINVFKSTKKL
jgi:5-methylcytosine-specific restriction endonuclease McrA